MSRDYDFDEEYETGDIIDPVTWNIHVWTSLYS